MTDTDNTICSSCALSKIRVKNLGHHENKSTTIGERISFDISSIKHISLGGAKYWLLIQDEYTGYIWSYFLSSRTETSNTLITWVKLFQKKFNTTVKHIRCDNAGENLTVQQEMEADSNINVTFEFTAPYTPQQNGKIERKFATLWGKVRSMLNTAKLPWNLRKKLWAQCANLATQLENILIRPGCEQSPYFQLHGKDPNWIYNLNTFGELAVIHDGRQKIASKLSDKGFLGIFVGYPTDHAGEVCQFLDLRTNSIISSRTAIFLNKMYADYFNLTAAEVSHMIESSEELLLDLDAVTDAHTDSYNLPTTSDPDDAEEDNEEFFDSLVEDVPDLVSEAISTTISSRGMRELRNLTTSYNPDPFRYLPGPTAMFTTFRTPPDICLQATIYDGNPDPKTYQEAIASPDWPNWWAAMCTEFNNMHEKQVWTIIPRNTIPSNRKIIGNRWVYVLKDDGRYRARTVAKGFTQIPGKDFQENHSPVVNDTTFHTILF